MRFSLISVHILSFFLLLFHFSSGSDLSWVYLMGDWSSRTFHESASPANNYTSFSYIGSRYSFTFCISSSGYFIQGGYGYDYHYNYRLNNDLWYFNASSLRYTLLSGDIYSNVSVAGVYSSRNYSSSNILSSRSNGQCLVMNSEVLFFGGEGKASSGYEQGPLNDMFMYSLELNEYKYVSGSPKTFSEGVYNYDESVLDSTGLVVPDNELSATAVPGGRYGHLMLGIDDVYVFGGRGVSASVIPHLAQPLNDLFVYNVGEGEWKWVSGSYQCCKKGDNEQPGARMFMLGWVIDTRYILMFGGKGFQENLNNYERTLNDLWKFDTLNNVWEFVSGVADVEMNSGKVSHIDATKRNIFHKDSYPHARFSSTFTQISNNLLMMYGGMYQDVYYNNNYLNDLWLLNLDSLEWAFIDIEFQNMDLVQLKDDYHTYPKNRVPVYYKDDTFRSYRVHPGSRSNHILYYNNGLVFTGMGRGNGFDDEDPEQYWLIYNDLFVAYFDTPKFDCGGGTDEYDVLQCNNELYNTSIVDHDGFYFLNEMYVNVKGVCVGDNTCLCADGRVDSGNEKCESTECFEKDSAENGVCTAHGKCFQKDVCICNAGYYDDACENWNCWSYNKDDTGVCRSHGKCVGANKCKCEKGFNDKDYLGLSSCSEEYDSGFDEVWSILLGVLGGTCILFCCFMSFFYLPQLGIAYRAKIQNDLKQFDEIEDLDVLIEEQKVAATSSLPQIKINRSMFEINHDDVKLLEKIDDQNNLVYKARWNEKIVAYKLFMVQNLDQNKYEAFEKEVGFLSSISHQHILPFMGASIKNTIGILSEFCDHGNVEEFLLSYKARTNRSYGFKKKIKFLLDIAAAISYLHSLDIIHRNIKHQAILINSALDVKLTGFRLSRVSRDDESVMTKAIGVDIYRAPEVTTSQKYTSSIDVYSLGILMFEILTENFNPYGDVSDLDVPLDIKIAQDSSFRPKINPLEFREIPELIELVTSCWDGNPEKRPPLKIIVSILTSILDKFEEVKMAFIVGMGEYEHLSKLPPSENDARDMCNLLTNFGFSCDKLINVNMDIVRTKFKEFIQRQKQMIEKNKYHEFISIWYFSGHGIVEKDKSSILLSINFNTKDIKAQKLKKTDGLDILELQDMMNKYQNVKNIIILDCCRSNIKGDFIHSDEIEKDNDKGSYLICYATDPGDVALSTINKINSPYTQSLLVRMKEDYENFEDLIRNVKGDVQLNSNKRQNPWYTVLNVNESINWQHSKKFKNERRSFVI